MHLPASTGEVAQFLGITEPRLNDLIRRGRIVPPPPVAAGRRHWMPAHVRQAAAHLGLLTPDVERQLIAPSEGVAGV